MNLIWLITTFLLIGDNYGQNLNQTKSLDPNATILPRKSGFRFEEVIEFSDPNDNRPITFEDHETPLKFDESVTPNENFGRITFQDDNKLEDNKKKKRRRRRRKPRYQNQGQFPGLIQGSYAGFPGQPLPGQAPYPAASGQGYPDGGSGAPGFGIGVRPTGHYYRPPRPKPSFASEALSKVTGALTSIALYDDYQCVPRLLCEAAGGGALGSSNVLQSVAGLQPLLTLLSAYSGISTSPLFVFGRAVFLGMTSKGNTGSCRYAYSQCPTDPEQLVHYLNNHNGGFFRFFSAPQQQIPQNLEQFYNQLSGYGLAPNQQNYGPYQPPNQQLYQPHNQNLQNPQYGLQEPLSLNGHYGYYNPQESQHSQQYGLYNQFNYPNPNPQFGPQNLQPNQQIDQQNYGFYDPQNQLQPYPNGLYNQFSGPQNPYANKFGYGYHKIRNPYKSKYNFNNVNFKDNSDKGSKIEKRIQNKPNYVYDDNDTENIKYNSNNQETFKWIFPEDYKKGNVIYNNVRGAKNLKFPDGSTKADNIGSTSNREAKSIIFPESQTVKYVNYNDYPPELDDDLRMNYQNYYVGNTAGNENYSNNGGYTNDQNLHKNAFNDDDEVQTVYIVRDDPNNPEIVKIRRGQKIE